jgi:hypothetical protein
MKNITKMGICITLAMLGGCAWPSAIGGDRNTMVALYSKHPITIDGRLDEPIWKKAAAYKMTLSTGQAAKGLKLQEAGEVRFAWDDRYFYVGVKFADSDIVAEGNADQLHHYQFGDVCELFLKPANQTWFWEMYVTPAGRRTGFFYLSQGRHGLPSNFAPRYLPEAAAVCKGTLNNWRDKDQYWTAEIAVPISVLTGQGDKFAPEADWRVLIGRYNYSYYLRTKGPELSAAPKLLVMDYHLLGQYAVLELQRKTHTAPGGQR